MQITIVDDMTGTPKIHKAGCADIRKAPARHVRTDLDAADRAAVALEWFDCIIEENDATPADYISELHFLPCCRALPDSADSWDCGSGQCDPNTGCPSCSDEDRTWSRRA